jgi:hypothetical protein
MPRLVCEKMASTESGGGLRTKSVLAVVPLGPDRGSCTLRQQPRSWSRLLTPIGFYDSGIQLGLSPAAARATLFVSMVKKRLTYFIPTFNSDAWTTVSPSSTSCPQQINSCDCGVLRGASFYRERLSGDGAQKYGNRGVADSVVLAPLWRTWILWILSNNSCGEWAWKIALRLLGIVCHECIQVWMDHH